MTLSHFSVTVATSKILYWSFAGGGSPQWGGLSVEAGSSFHWQWTAVGFTENFKCPCVCV